MLARVDYQEAARHGWGVTEINPNGAAAEEVKALWSSVKRLQDELHEDVRDHPALKLTEQKVALLQEMRPFLENPKQRGQRLGDTQKAASAFAGLRTLMPAAGQDTLGDLAEICDEAQQLIRQERLHHWLHGWLLLHIPLSLALILLGAIHAVMALRF